MQGKLNIIDFMEASPASLVRSTPADYAPGRCSVWICWSTGSDVNELKADTSSHLLPASPPSSFLASGVERVVDCNH
jgi:hypothetical protein